MMDTEKRRYPSPKLIHPSTVLVCGPTGCGKTRLVSRMLVESKFEPMPERIVWIYSEWQKLYDELGEVIDVEFIKGMPQDLYESLSPKTSNLIVLDDQMSAIGNSKQLVDLFSIGSHHRNLTVIFIVQNMFHQGKAMRTTALNTQYQILFKSPRDIGQIAMLGYQMFPEHKKFLPAVFKAVTQKPFGYLLLDMHPNTEESRRVRTPIFDDEQNIVYQPV